MKKNEDPHDINTVVVIGEVARDATVVEREDGQVFTSFDVICRIASGRTVVPITAEQELAVAEGARVAILGRVNKRFFAAGTGLASGTDVRADKVTVIRRKDHVSRVIAAAAASLGLG